MKSIRRKSLYRTLSDPEVVVYKEVVILYDVEHLIGSGRINNLDFLKTIDTLRIIFKI